MKNKGKTFVRNYGFPSDRTGTTVPETGRGKRLRQRLGLKAAMAVQDTASKHRRGRKRIGLYAADGSRFKTYLCRYRHTNSGTSHATMCLRSAGVAGKTRHTCRLQTRIVRMCFSRYAERCGRDGGDTHQREQRKSFLCRA